MGLNAADKKYKHTRTHTQADTHCTYNRTREREKKIENMCQKSLIYRLDRAKNQTKSNDNQLNWLPVDYKYIQTNLYVMLGM